jgi:thymidine kinase
MPKKNKVKTPSHSKSAQSLTLDRKKNHLNPELILYIGSCSGGKTSKALLRGENYERVGWKVAYLKPRSSHITSHTNGLNGGHEETIIQSKNSSLSKKGILLNQLHEFATEVEDYHVVVIDDGYQFSDLQLCKKWVTVSRIKVIVASLDKNPLTQLPYWNVLNLIPHATSIKKIREKNHFHHHHQASISMYIGPCAGGKTTTALLDGENAERNGLRVAYLVSSKKTTEGVIQSRNSDLSKDGYSLFMLSEFNDRMPDYDLAIIDEGWMFDDLLVFCQTWTHQHHHKQIIISSIDSLFSGKPLENLLSLVPSDNVIRVKKMKAVCDQCHHESGLFTHRITKDTCEVDVNNSHYITVCDVCFYQLGHASVFC